MAVEVGVTHKPDVTLHRLQPEDQYLIAASDGVWELITSQVGLWALTARGRLLRYMLRSMLKQFPHIAFEWWLDGEWLRWRECGCLCLLGQNVVPDLARKLTVCKDRYFGFCGWWSLH